MRADTMDDRPCRSFFLQPRSTFHRRYEALRAFFIEGRPPAEVAIQFGYKPAALKVLISRFRHDVRGQDIPPFSSRTAADDPRADRAATIRAGRTRPPSPISGPWN
jgi:hypothetical protein